MNKAFENIAAKSFLLGKMACGIAFILK